MTLKQLLINVAKLLLCSFAFFAGTIIGGMIARLLGLNPPTPPAGLDSNTLILYSLLATPLIALALLTVAQGLGGNFLTRAAMLSFFTWICYTVNTQLEASIFSTYAAGFWFAITDYFVASLFCGSLIAYLFSPKNRGIGFIAAGRAFFGSRTTFAWIWHLIVAAVAFMPIYFIFGLMVVPFTSEYYRQNMFGLSMPTINQILPILFVRSILFLLACLPIFILWQKSNLALFWRLGTALYILVGLIYMFISTWLPPYIRFPHALEILADEFVYAGVLVILLTKGKATTK